MSVRAELYLASWPASLLRSGSCPPPPGDECVLNPVPPSHPAQVCMRDGDGITLLQRSMLLRARGKTVNTPNGRSNQHACTHAAAHVSRMQRWWRRRLGTDAGQRDGGSPHPPPRRRPRPTAAAGRRAATAAAATAALAPHQRRQNAAGAPRAARLVAARLLQASLRPPARTLRCGSAASTRRTFQAAAAPAGPARARHVPRLGRG
jgi:hypothetical protein